MPVNHYFQGGNGIGSDAEKRLYENLIIEGLKIYGQDVYYLPRTLVNRDLILGEDVASKFNAAYLLKCIWKLLRFWYAPTRNHKQIWIRN